MQIPEKDIANESLFRSIVANRPGDVTRAIQSGADPNARRAGGITALHTAVLSAADDALKTLIAFKPDLDAQDSKGITPLHYATQNRSKTALDLLISAGANVNIKDLRQLTPLDWTVPLAEEEKAAMLIAAGATPGTRPLKWTESVPNEPLDKKPGR